MKIKLLAGIILPLLIMISLIFLSNSNIGFSVKKETVKSINFDDLFSENKKSGGVFIQTINVSNGFFLPRKLVLPNLLACAIDDENSIKRAEFDVRYSEGAYSSKDGFIFDEIFFDLDDERSIDIPSNSQKQVKIFIKPKYLYNYEYDNNVNNYLMYDQLFLIETNANDNLFSYNYNACDNVGSRKLEKSISIKIDNQNAKLREKSSEEFLVEYPNSLSDTLSVGTTKTYTINSVNFEVTLNYQDNGRAQFIINGWTSKLLKEGEKDKLPDGSVIMVSRIIGSGKSGNNVQFYLGKK